MLGVVYAFAVKDVAERRPASSTRSRARSRSCTAQANSLADLHPGARAERGRRSSRSCRSPSRASTGRTRWSRSRSRCRATSRSTASRPSPATARARAPRSSRRRRRSAGAPTFALSGCASSQSEIATILTRLESVPSVTNVSLCRRRQAGRQRSEHEQGHGQPQFRRFAGGQVPARLLDDEPLLQRQLHRAQSEARQVLGLRVDDLAFDLVHELQRRRRGLAGGPMKVRDRLILAVVAAVIVVGAVWLVLVSPERSKASNLGTQITTEQRRAGVRAGLACCSAGDRGRLPRRRRGDLPGDDRRSAGSAGVQHRHDDHEARRDLGRRPRDLRRRRRPPRPAGRSRSASPSPSRRPTRRSRASSRSSTTCSRRTAPTSTRAVVRSRSTRSRCTPLPPNKTTATVTVAAYSQNAAAPVAAATTTPTTASALAGATGVTGATPTTP